MERVNHIYVNRLSSSEAVDSLDVRLLACGLGERIHSWPVNPFFSSEPFYRIYLPLEGSFRLLSPEEELELKPGALYLIPALTPLKFIPVSPCTHYWCHFLSERLRYIPAPGRMYRVRCRSRRRYEAVFQALFALLAGADTMAAAVEIRHRMDTLLLPFLEAVPLFGEHPVSEDGRIRQVLDYIEEHLKEPIRIGTLCRRINMSESDFLKKFHRQQGVSPKQYIVSRRLSAAKVLLIQSDKTVAEIASECGYSSVYFFCRQFRKYLEKSPAQFRHSQRAAALLGR